MKVKYNHEDLSSRLRGGYITYKAKPCYVSEIHYGDNGTFLQLNELFSDGSHGKAFEVPYDDDNITIDPPPLGYVNTSRGAFWMVRDPVRSYKQSFQPSSVSTHNGGRSIEMSCLFNWWMNIYPSAKEVIEDLKNQKFRSQKMAISRDVALGSDEIGIIRLFYKGDAIAVVEDSKIIIPDFGVAGTISRIMRETPELRGYSIV